MRHLGFDVTLKDGVKANKRITCHIQTIQKAKRWITKKYGERDIMTFTHGGLAWLYFNGDKGPGKPAAA